MTTTKTYGNLYQFFGISSITSAIADIAGAHADHFNMDDAADAYRQYLTHMLPGSLVIVGDQVRGNSDDAEAKLLNLNDFRQDCVDTMAVEPFDISPYGIDDADDDASDDTESSDSERLRTDALQAANRAFDIASNLMGAAGTFAMTATARSFQEAGHAATRAAAAFEAAAALFEIAGEFSARGRAMRRSSIAAGRSAHYDHVQHGLSALESESS